MNRYLRFKTKYKLDISPLVSQVGGQVGYLKKQNSSRNLIFLASAAVFQLHLNKLQQTTQKWHHFAQFWTFLKIVQVWMSKVNSLKNFASF